MSVECSVVCSVTQGNTVVPVGTVKLEDRQPQSSPLKLERVSTQLNNSKQDESHDCFIRHII